MIRINDLKTVEDITNYTKAGAFCKSCIRPGGHEPRKYYLVDILKEVREEMERERLKEKVEVKDFRQMSLIQKHRVLEKVLDEKVRPILLKDGGDLEVVDMKENGAKVEVYIHYLGSCDGCPSGIAGTQMYIEEVLRSELDENIRVVVV